MISVFFGLAEADYEGASTIYTYLQTAIASKYRMKAVGEWGRVVRNS